MSDLKPCPFCGEKHDLRVFEYGKGTENWDCFVQCQNCSVTGACSETDKQGAIDKWNRRTQPEATAPAQDLSAAILAITANKRAADHLNMREFNGYLEGFAEARNKAAALASSTNALSAGDSETARLDFVFANGLPMKRGGEYRCHGFPGEWFKTEREAIDVAILQSQKTGPCES